MTIPTPSPAPASGAETPLLMRCSHCNGSMFRVLLPNRFQCTNCHTTWTDTEFAAPTPESPREAGTKHRLAGNSNYEMAGVRARAAAPTTEGPREEPWWQAVTAASSTKHPCESPAASRPGAPEEGIIPQDADLVRRIVRDAQRRPLSGTETVYLRSLAASLAALTSEVARLNAQQQPIVQKSVENIVARRKAESEVARLTEENKALKKNLAPTPRAVSDDR